jgi:hypothetical protein
VTARRDEARRHARAEARAGFLWRHLVGEYSLGRSYWLHTVLLGWGLAAFGAWVFRELGDRSSMRSVSIAVLCFEPLVVAVWLWSMFGTTMSALRRLVDGSQIVWALLALLSLGIGTLATVRELGRMGPYLREHWAVAQGKQPTERFEVTLRDEGRVVFFSGGINDGAAAAIDKAIGEAPRVGTCSCILPGGWLREGRRMADVVQRYRLNTRVEGECFSACTLVLLAGANRSAGERALIGFHRGRSIGESADDRSLPARAEETELYRRAGLKPEFVRRIVTTPNDDIWIPSRSELLREDVLTR